MSLLRIDIGTTRCRAAVFSEEGRLLTSVSEEHNIQRPKPGRAELDAFEVSERGYRRDHFRLKEVHRFAPTNRDRDRRIPSGSKSDVWIQICAAIVGQPFVRPRSPRRALWVRQSSPGLGMVYSRLSRKVLWWNWSEPSSQIQSKRLYKSQFERYNTLLFLMSSWKTGEASVDLGLQRSRW